MANYNTIKQGIKNAIKQNGTRAITGDGLQNVLVNMVDSLGKYGKFAGVATPGTTPSATDENVFYMTAEAGTYTKFNSVVVNSGELAFLTNMDGNWEKYSVNINSQSPSTSDIHTITVSGELLNVQNHDTGITADSWQEVLKYKLLKISGDVDVYNKDVAFAIGWQRLENKDILLALVGMSYKYPSRLVPMLGKIQNTAGNGRLYISEASMGEGIPDAPSDGELYGRKNNKWAKVPSGTGGGISDAPADGNLYGRKDNNWEIVPEATSGIPEAPSDGNIYGRKDKSWEKFRNEFEAGRVISAAEGGSVEGSFGAEPKAGDLIVGDLITQYVPYGMILEAFERNGQFIVTYIYGNEIHTLVYDADGSEVQYESKYKIPTVYNADVVNTADSGKNMQDLFKVSNKFVSWKVGDLLVGSNILNGGVIVSDKVETTGRFRNLVYIYDGEIVTIRYNANSPYLISKVIRIKIGQSIIPSENVVGASQTKELLPNVFYKFGQVTTLTITFGGGISGAVNEYMFQFDSGSTPTTLSLPQSVKWLNGQPLQVQANKTYQVSIVNNLAVGGEF